MKTQRGAAALDRSIARLAGQQHGVVARRQLLTFATPGAIGGRVRRGSLHPLHRGVYAVGYSVVGPRGNWMAATLAAGPESALSHRSAGQLWGITPVIAIAPEVTVPRGWRGQVGICLRRSHLRPDEVTEVDRIPATGLSRTLLDLASVVSKRRLERALNEAEVRGLTDRLSLPELLERYPRRQGTAVLRSILSDEAALTGITESDFEEAFLALLDVHRLPRPRLNADLNVAGSFFRVDALWDGAKLIVEVDGRAVHGTSQAFESDKKRDRLLLVEGWRVMRLTWKQLRDESAEVVADLRNALGGGAASTL